MGAMSVVQYRGMLNALLPPGRAFQFEEGSELDLVLNNLSGWLKQVDDRVLIILAESDPRVAEMLLPEWEISLGLPDECTVLNPTIKERQQAVYAKFADEGGARIPRYLGLARRLGYEKASITRFKAHTCELHCEFPITDFNWRFAWQLNLPKEISITEFTCQSSVEEALRNWGESAIECVINRESQAIGCVIFAYTEE